MSFDPLCLPPKTIKSQYVKYDAVFTTALPRSSSAACGHRVIPEQSIANQLMGLELLSAETFLNSAVHLISVCVSVIVACALAACVCALECHVLSAH